MVDIEVKLRDGTLKSISTSDGAVLMEALRDSGIDEVLAQCGGQRSCATCHVYVDDEFTALMTTMSEDEDDLLESSDHRTAFSRLSCQIIVTPQMDGMKVQIAPEG